MIFPAFRPPELISQGEPLLPETVPGVCQLFRHVLSRGECEEMIQRFESIGYESAQRAYPASYRNNDRIVLDDQELGRSLFERLKQCLPPRLVDSAGQGWRLVGLNERFRCCRYQTGQWFHIHRDGVYQRSEQVRSCLTFMIYLNGAEEFQGGDTRFFESKDSESPLLSRVAPEQGSLIVFNHDLWHDGETVTKGRKYILRSDILYEREAENTVSIPHAGYVWCVSELSDGRIATGSRDKTIRIWDRKGSTLHLDEILSGHASSVTCVAEDRLRVVWSGSRDGELRRWADGVCRDVLNPQAGAVICLRPLLGGDMASGHADGSIRLWTARGEERSLIQAHQGWVWSLDLTSAGEVVSVSEDGEASVWDATSLARSASCRLSAPIWACASRRDGTVALGCGNGQVWIWRPGMDPTLAPGWLPEWRGGIRSLVALSNGSLISGDEDDRLIHWDEELEHPFQVQKHGDFVSAVRVLKDGTLVSGSYDSDVHLLGGHLFGSPATPTQNGVRR